VTDTDTYRDLAEDVFDVVIDDGNGSLATLVLDLVAAAIFSADRSGLGSDEVWRIARKIKKMREAH
jgi:hypothetical protein